jgi:hypothetical protein
MLIPRSGLSPNMPLQPTDDKKGVENAERSAMEQI